VYVRCADCLSATWVEILAPEGPVDAVVCGVCERRIVLSPIEELGSQVRDHYRRALRCASELDLDIASAYSVLLGIMSREQAEILRHSQLPAPTPADEQALEPGLDATADGDDPADPEAPSPERALSAPEAADRLPLVPDFDLGFTRAIAEGRLTVQEAMIRGERGAFAARLARRHRLSERLAYQVTDNRIGLREALRLQEEARDAQQPGPASLEPPGEDEPASPAASHRQILLVLGTAAVAISAVLWSTWTGLAVERPPRLETRVTSEPATVPTRAPASPQARQRGALIAATEVRTDHLGRALEIVGPDPVSVLVAYCEAPASQGRRVPAEIVSTVPRFRHARLGIFHDFAALEARHAIRIRKDARTGRWVAGGPGTTLIPVGKVPDLPADAVRIPVSAR